VSLLVEAPPGRHLAQLHRDAGTFTESVFTFLEAGIRRGQGVVIIATPDNLERLSARLAQSKLDPRALQSADQLAMTDASAVVGQTRSNGSPQWARFRNALSVILDRVQNPIQGTRIYTEMSSVLWSEGNVEGAIHVEELWNTLIKARHLSLYCGYALDTQSEASYAGPLEEVGHAHTDILGTDDDERFGIALDQASKEIFGITLSQMAGMSRQDGARRFPSGQRTMLWVTRNLPMSTAQLAERARRYFQEGSRRGP
jgi:MEDS: MEthanogen/methylotroph, DcmR Sensory domain